MINTKQEKDSYTTMKRRAIWRRVETTLNEKCGTNYDWKKLEGTFCGMKRKPSSKYYSLIYDDPPK